MSMRKKRGLDSPLPQYSTSPSEINNSSSNKPSLDKNKRNGLLVIVILIILMGAALTFLGPHNDTGTNGSNNNPQKSLQVTQDTHRQNALNKFIEFGNLEMKKLTPPERLLWCNKNFPGDIAQVTSLGPSGLVIM